MARLFLKLQLFIFKLALLVANIAAPLLALLLIKLQLFTFKSPLAWIAPLTPFALIKLIFFNVTLLASTSNIFALPAPSIV